MVSPLETHWSLLIHTVWLLKHKEFVGYMSRYDRAKNRDPRACVQEAPEP